MKNRKLQIIWLIPNVLKWMLFIGFSIWMVINAEGLKEIEMLSGWVLQILFF
mgnify:CR=1 FL=1